MANRIKESNITPGAVTSDKIAPGTVSASNISPGTITGAKIAPATVEGSNIAPATITAPNIGPAAVGASNISPGAITTTQISPTAGIVSGQIAPGTIANDRLANNSVTINGSSVSLGGSVDISAGTDWQSVVTADGSTATTASAGEGYFIDTTSAAHTINLPSSPSQGDEVHIVDYAGTFGSNNVTVGRNSSNIDGSARDATLGTNRESVRFVYIDATQGWKSVFDGASTQYVSPFITATGGTVTTSGDYKIHTFTGDGCFTVSYAGAGTCASPSVVDYLVVAGGGGSGGNHNHIQQGGGGGAGGYREAKSGCAGCYTVSPLATPTGITITATTYPITVGAGGSRGGSGGNLPSRGPNATSGSNSIFSTITSAGGGFGGQPGACCVYQSTGQPGGSGGAGGGGGGTQAGGSGNTPPVSPPQGNNGGCGQSGGPTTGGSGGGATGNGTQGPSCGSTGPNANTGGTGATSAITGSSVTRSTGGNWGWYCGPTWNPVPDGGTNTGDGAPANSGAAPEIMPFSPATNYQTYWYGKNGGKGIVVIRYKFQ